MKVSFCAGFPVIRTQRDRILLIFRANLGATIVWLKGNTRDQTQFDLAFSRAIKPDARSREAENVSVCLIS